MQRLQTTLLLPVLLLMLVFAGRTQEQETYRHEDGLDSSSHNRLLQTIMDFTLKKKEEKNKQNLQKIPGVPWIDYPLYHEAPATSFSCEHVPALPGMYANVETGCQVYHVCHDGREGEQGATFLCANGTIFNQKSFACDWWYNVDCSQAQTYYNLNLDPETNPYVPPAHKEYIRQERLRVVVV